MTPAQKHELRALVAALGPDRTLILMMDREGHLVPLAEVPHQFSSDRRNGKGHRLLGNGQGGGNLSETLREEIPGVDIEVRMVDTHLSQDVGGSSIAYVVQQKREK